MGTVDYDLDRLIDGKPDRLCKLLGPHPPDVGLPSSFAVPRRQTCVRPARTTHKAAPTGRTTKLRPAAVLLRPR
jgi:hypothetical protein